MNGSRRSAAVKSVVPAHRSGHAREVARFGPDERGFVLAVTRRFIRDDEEAADVTQEAMLLAYRHRDSFRGESRYRTWLYRIAATTALSHLRRTRRRRAYAATLPGGPSVNSDEVWEPAAEVATPEEQVGSHEAARLARGHLDALGEMYRRVFLLRVEDECSEAEIAAHLGLSVATVKIRTHRARKFLRERMADARP